MSCERCGHDHCVCPRTVTVAVNAYCESADFKRLVEAVNFCNDGDTITQCRCHRCAETFNIGWVTDEQVVIDKDLTLIGRRDA